jgi:hypothetical protein
MIVFNHRALARRRVTEVARFHRWARSLGPGEVFDLAIEHEPDRSCCRVEPWKTTLAILIGAARAAQPQEEDRRG